MKIDHPFVDAHLEPVPSLGSLATRSFTSGDAKSLGGNANRALNLEALVLSALDEIRANLLQTFHIPGCERDADAVDDGFLGSASLSRCGRFCFRRHF